MTTEFRRLFLTAATLAVLVTPVVASDPMGLYCIVDRVVLEPTDQPLRAQVWGTCALADRQTQSYQPAVKGYLYYSLPAGKEEAARAEWRDLLRLAGTNEPVAFGARHQPTGRMRPATEAVGAPDAYPIQMGVMRLGAIRYPGLTPEKTAQLKATAATR